MSHPPSRSGFLLRVLRTAARALVMASLACAASAFVPGAVTIASADEPSAAQILKRADEVRNPGESYFLRVQVSSSEGSGAPSEFEVSLLGNDKTLVRTLQPSRDRGRDLLMRGTQMWAFIPNLKRAVRVSLSQKLVGQAANGDISRMQWSGDYDAAIEKQDDKTWTIFLTGNKQGLTYAKVRVVIEKGSFHPLTAEYLTVAGSPLKKAQFAEYKDLLGRKRPTVIRIQDALRPADRSTIQVLDMQVRQFPASLFVPETLGR